jgi:primosomal protein N' (replication factor Y)
MSYAEVAVNSPIAQRRTFSYTVPPSINPAIGQAVWVPFGTGVVQGILFELTDRPGVEQTKEIVGVIDPHPLLTPTQIELARWISEYYLAPLFDAVALMLPPGFERRLVTLFHLSPGYSVSLSHASFTPEERQLLRLLEKGGKVAQRVVEKVLGKKKATLVLRELLGKGLVSKSQELEGLRVRPKVLPYLRLAVDAHAAVDEAERIARRAPKQAALLRLLADRQTVSLAEAEREVQGTRAGARALQVKGLIVIEDVQVWRDPLLNRVFRPGVPPVLAAAQKAALEEIRAVLREPAGNGNGVFLLHGVTGSGKTEVYLRALAEVVALGKRGIVLVPEISLTPQTVDRFASRFPGSVAVLHSKLSPGEQFDEWQRIKEGAFDVVIGPRGAIFAPQPDLGLIIIDEEHEWTYKQEGQTPRYHARDAALKLAELSGAIVILGSATPDVGSYYRSQTGSCRLLQLPQRITSGGVETPLPEVDVVDMREELKAENRSIFSRSLSRAIAETLAAGDQAILFLNRRGTATFVQCRDCGFALKCHRCDLALTYHGVENMLICHQCGYKKEVPAICPSCLSRRIRFLGIGTQRVGEEVARAFPKARVLRWDRDVTRGRNAHERILKSFLAHEADILIGTQMVAKGLDLPLVTLVGVLSADTVLHFPDIRACERTFQLLSQVAGRAGRGSRPGRVIVQTYSPDHYAVAWGGKHDYASFYHQEIDYRRQLKNPPFSRLVSLVYAHSNAQACRQGAERMHQRLMEKSDSEGRDVDLIGPSPMFFGRLRGRFRWQIILRGQDPSCLLADVSLPQGWVVDVDPVGLL